MIKGKDMSIPISEDPRARRSRNALQQAFKDLLQIKPYSKITIKDLADLAGIARHTFYNHYETKQDLLDNLVDSVLDHFFLQLVNWNLFLADPEEEQAMLTAFFQTWRDHSDIVKLLEPIDIELVISGQRRITVEKYQDIFR
jgi:AcrR family transcriptional regulator